MKTFMRIATERAPEDPTWMVKKKAGKKLNPIEADEYFAYKFEQDHNRLITEKNFEGVPSHA
jgi:hypothetical protein